MSPIRTARPYAAKAIIEHAFDVDHLDIWITFRFPMLQDVKPANALWKCKVNGIVKAVTASAWQDEYTMLLTVAAIASIPDTVTIEYDGPSLTLMTTWLKQWEPWGPILSSDSLPLPYGSFKGNEIAWSQVAAQDVWYTVSDAQITVNITNKITFQNNQELKVSVNGIYQVNFYLTMECSIANKHALIAIEINGVEQLMGQNHVEFGRAGEESNISGVGQFVLTVDDLVSIGISTPDAGNPTFEVDHIGLTMHEIGKTGA